MFAQKRNNLLPIISDKFRRSDNNFVYIFTNARDEPNIAEWIAHHILLGFDKVIVFDHLSETPIQQKLGTNFDNKLLVKRVEGAGNIKLKLMTKAVEMCNNENVSWMLYLDADEFLSIPSNIKIKQMLSYFSQADAIGINWLFFGSSGFKEQPKGLITNNFIRSELRVNKHVKSFVRPYVVKRIDNPHFYNIANPNRYFSITGRRMIMNPFDNNLIPFTKIPAYIAHYYIQSEEEHLRRKKRALDDGSSNKLGLMPVIHKIYNNVVNNQLQNKYSHNITNFLKKYNIVL